MAAYYWEVVRNNFTSILPSMSNETYRKIDQLEYNRMKVKGDEANYFGFESMIVGYSLLARCLGCSTILVINHDSCINNQ